MRWLIQKDGNGEWQITGAAVKVSRPASVVSNLHSGGHIYPAASYLMRHFPAEQADRILTHCEALVQKIAPFIEAKFGQMAEFGIDLGVDTCGRIWVIEVNPKPGRDIFKKLGGMEHYLIAVRRPLLYGKYLLQRQALERIER
jgi:hypothetical protein